MLAGLSDPDGRRRHLHDGVAGFEGNRVNGGGVLRTAETPFGTLSAVTCWDTDFPPYPGVNGSFYRRPAGDRRPSAAGRLWLLLRGFTKGVPFLSQFEQFLLHPIIEGAGRVLPVCVAFAGWDAGQEFNAFIDGVDGIDIKFPPGHSMDDIPAQHQMLQIGARDDHALITGQPSGLAQVEETFDLFVYATNRLDLTMLVHRAGDRQRLGDWRLSNGREQGKEFSGRGAVAFDTAVGLLENQAGSKGKGFIHAIARSQKTGKNEYPFRMDRPTELHLAFDIDHFPFAHLDARCNPAGPTKGEGAKLDKGKPIDLADLGAGSVDQQCTV